MPAVQNKNRRERRRQTLCLGLLAWLRPGWTADEGIPTLRLLSSDLPPYAIEGQPGRPGAMIELAEATLQRAGMPAAVEFYPWVRAHLLALNEHRVLIAPLLRTPEREGQFQWLLRLYPLHRAFMSRGTEPAIASLEQARGLRIAVLRGTPDQRALISQGFSAAQLVLGSSTEDVLRLLEREHAGAIFGSDAMYLEKQRQRGKPANSLQLGLRQPAGDIWLAGSAGFEPEERQRLQQALAQLRREGTMERILRAYGLALPAD